MTRAVEFIRTQIDWSSLIQQLLTYSSREGQIANVDKIYVEDVNYLKRLIRLMSYSSTKTLGWWNDSVKTAYVFETN